MSESRRHWNRRRNNYQRNETPTFTLAKRETVAAAQPKKQQAEVEQYPKLLLRSKPEPVTVESVAKVQDATDAESMTPSSSQKILLLAHSEVRPNSPSHKSLLLNENEAVGNEPAEGAAAIVPAELVTDKVPKMSRPATVISSAGQISLDAKELLQKNNKEFFIVGVIGMQGVGKSTILNLLAENAADDKVNFDATAKVPAADIFPTKRKQHKCTSRSRTESTQMFITENRRILLDTPPVLCNAFKKDMTHCELDDLRSIVLLLSSTHLLIVVLQDLNMGFLHMLLMAEQMMPANSYAYRPAILFIKNQAQSEHFAPKQLQLFNETLQFFFKDSKLRIYLGQKLDEQQGVRVVNSFLLPHFKGNECTIYHDRPQDIVRELRERISMTPRCNIKEALSVDFTETSWFEHLTAVSLDANNFYFKAYEIEMRSHFDKKADLGDDKNSSSRNKSEDIKDKL